MEKPYATIFNLLGFITTVSLMANSHYLTDGLPSLAVHANRVINGLAIHAVVRHLLSVVQAGTID